MVKSPFQHKMERSSSSHAILETSSRKRKAAKIQKVLQTRVDLAKSTVLDIGTGSGHIAHELSAHCKKVTSVDIVDERKEKRGYNFKLADDETLPFSDQSFDVVITNHVVEHTPNQKKHLKEVMRVLKPGGIVYLATPNKLWLTDPHYRLPFISWLPRRLSGAYLRATQGKVWDIYPLSTSDIRASFRGHRVENALPLLLTKAADGLDTWQGAVRVARYIPRPLLNSTQYISPTLIFLIEKSTK